MATTPYILASQGKVVNLSGLCDVLEPVAMEMVTRNVATASAGKLAQLASHLSIANCRQYLREYEEDGREARHVLQDMAEAYRINEEGYA